MCMVSIVIPYFNSDQTLARALDSVRNQTYQDWELILVNDGSTDNSEQMVNEYFQQYHGLRYKHLSQSNMGPSGARNTAIKNAQGQYIAFLDSDDAWEPQKLEIQIDFMEKNPDVAITGTNCYIVKESRWAKYPLQPPVIEANYYRLLFKVFFLTPTVVIRREVFFQDELWFREGKNHAEDLLLFLQIVRRYCGARLSIPLTSLFKREYGETGLTADLPELLVNELDNLKVLAAENHLLDKNRISFALYMVLVIYSYLKHVKRILNVKLFQLKDR